MKKKKVIWLLTLLACCCTVAGVACKDDEAGDSEPTVYASVELAVDEMSLSIGDTKLLMPDYSYVSDIKLSYESSNESVATVDANGVVTAKALGTATITVYYGDASDSCTVTVGFNSLMPILKVPAVNGDSVQMGKNTFLDLNTVVSFNGLEFTDAEVTYSLKDSSFGTISNGVFTPAKTGTTEIYVSGKWHGEEGASMKKTIYVTVLSDVEISINAGYDKELTLYTLDDTVLPFTVTCSEDGKDEQGTVTLTKGAEYINFDNNTVQSKGIAGYAELTVSFTGKSGNVYERIIPVNVKHTVKPYAVGITNFSALDGDVVGSRNLRSILGEDITAAEYGDGLALRVEDNKIYDLPTSGKEMTETTMIVYGSTYALEMEVDAYTKVIDTAEDFAMFYTGCEGLAGIEASAPFDGYYILANNIDAYSYQHAKVGESYVTSNASQFKSYAYDRGLTGTFDGNGYTVEGITLDSYGLFGHVNTGAIKNVAFTNVSFTGNSTTCVFAAYVMDATFTNIYVQTNGYGGGRRGVGTVWCDSINCTVENMLIETPDYTGKTDTTKASNGYGSISYMCGEKANTSWAPTFYRNVYVVSPTILTYLGRRSYQVDGENRQVGAVVPEGFKAHYLSGVHRYDTVADFQAANIEYSGIPDMYWSTENGVLSWKSKAAPALDESTLDAKITMFSAADGDIDLKKAFGASASQTVVLTGAMQGGQVLTVDGNKILGVTPKIIREDGYAMGVGLVALTLMGTVDGVEKSVYIGVEAYTKVIDEASDLAIFHDTAETYTENTNPQDGYYILANDIDASNYTHAIYSSGYNVVAMNVSMLSTNNYATGLRGTFDGNGYTIDGITLSSHGLFGHVNGGIVKNVAFTNVKFGSWNSYVCVLASYVADARIENVYVEVDAYGKRPNYVGLLWVDSCNSKISNVLVEIPAAYTGTCTNGYGSMSAWNGTIDPKITNNYAANTYENVYFISKTALTVRSERNYVVDASNRADTVVGTCTTYTLSGVYRYDDYASMKAANNAYATLGELWTVTNGQLVWVGK